MLQADGFRTLRKQRASAPVGWLERAKLVGVVVTFIRSKATGHTTVVVDALEMPHFH